MTTSQRRELAGEAITIHGLSERQPCRLLDISRTSHRYQPRQPDDSELIARLQELAERKPRWGVGKMVERAVVPRGYPSRRRPKRWRPRRFTAKKS